MNLSDWLPYIAIFSALGSGVFAVVKWADQRRRELEEKRSVQYWRLVDTCTESTFVAKQKVAILQLIQFPEFADETIEFLVDAKTRKNSPWAKENERQIDKVLNHFRARRPTSS